MIHLAEDTISKQDIAELCNWLGQEKVPRLTKGELTVQYEEAYAKSCGRKYAVFVNSGSAANLIALYALIADNSLKNKKVVVSALSWITTISPIIQFGLEPILCDIDMANLAASTEHLEQLFETEKPACLFLVSILGIPPDMERIEMLCRKYDVILLCDNCESQGSSIGSKQLESYGVMSTCSSYFGHITATIEGGMITTDDRDYYNLLKMLRSHGWDRDIDAEYRDTLRSDWNISEFNGLYTFYHPGFNVRSTEINAFLGLRQLDKLNDFVHARNHNFELYHHHIKNDYWKPKVGQDSIISNLGYPIIHLNRDKIVAALGKANVEVRPLVSGSMGMQPFWIKKYCRTPLPNVSIIDQFGLYLPNHPSLTEGDIIYVSEIVNDHLN
ncbi:MAG: DegT/DnrJ/EryC1/StrS family aminotransferase [Flavobacteriaceae bacterium]|nr:DegT/DnrJ/EryC1/StrS family aminotransferase [Flavobacteriaceae bacterium]